MRNNAANIALALASFTMEEMNRRIEKLVKERDEAHARIAELSQPEPPSTHPMCERKTNHIIERDGYAKTGYVLKKDGARICVSDGGAVAWFELDQWQWLMHNRDHVEFAWPKPVGSAPVAARELDVEAERREFEEWLFKDAESGTYVMSAQAGWMAHAARSAAQGTAQRLVSAEDKLHALHAEADELGAALDRDIALYGSGGAPVSTEQAGDAWISVEDRLPEPGKRVLVTRFAGRVINPGHPGHPGVPWTEVSSIQPGFALFACDLCSTGSVTHWKHAPAAPSPNNSPVGAKEQGND